MGGRSGGRGRLNLGVLAGRPPVSFGCRAIEILVAVVEEDQGVGGVCGGQDCDAHIFVSPWGS